MYIYICILQYCTYAYVYYIYNTNMETICPPGFHHNGSVATLHHVPKCMSCHKAIVVITGRANCHDYMYITLILLL